MIPRRCNALRNRHLASGSLFYQPSRASRVRVWATQFRDISTEEGLSERQNGQPESPEIANDRQEGETPGQSQSSESERNPQAADQQDPPKRTFSIRRGNNPYRIGRVNQLQNWTSRKFLGQDTTRRPEESQDQATDEKTDLSYHAGTRHVRQPLGNKQRSDNVQFKSDGEGNLSPMVRLQPGTFARIVKYTFSGNDNKLIRNSNEKDFVQPERQQRQENIEGLFQKYGSKYRPSATTWAPDNIEGLDTMAALLEQTERAGERIDRTLRQKLLKTFADIPIEAPNESELDLTLFTKAILEIPKRPKAEGRETDASGFYSKLPPQIVEKLQHNHGRLARLTIPKNTWEQLNIRETTILLENMHDDSIISSTTDLLSLAKEGRIGLTRDLADKLLIPLGNRGMTKEVKSIVQLCQELNVPVHWSHLLRGYRFELRRDPSKMSEVHSLVTKLAREGFDERSYAALMHLYSDAGRRDLAVALFNNAESFLISYPVKTTFVHNALLMALREGGLAEEVEYIFHAMKKEGPPPDETTYGHVAQVYRMRPDYFQKLAFLVRDYIMTGLPFRDEIFTALMKGCAFSGRVDITIALFQHLFSKPDLYPSKLIVTDYLVALMDAKADAVNEEMFKIGMPMHEKLPLEYDESEVETKFTSGKEDEVSENLPSTDQNEESPVVPSVDVLDPDHEKFQIPMAPVTPSTSGELLSLVDLQYQHLRKHYPHIVTRDSQRLLLRLFVSQGFFETFKKAYRYVALATGLRGRESMFPDYQRRTRTASFSDFGKESAQLPPIRPEERFEFDYLNMPLSQLDVYAALRAAFETKDLEFAKLVIQDYDTLIRDHADKLQVREKVRENWSMTSEAMILNTLAHCGDIEAAFQRFEEAMDKLVWDADRPRLFAKRIGVFTGILLNEGLTNMSNRVFERLQVTEWEKQLMRRQNPRSRIPRTPQPKPALDPTII